MGNFFQFVLNNSVPGRDADFNEWYDTVHMDDVMQMPGFINHQRLQVIGAPRGAGFPWKYAALYAVDVERPELIVQEIAARRGTPKMRSSDASQYETLGLTFWQAVEDHASGTVDVRANKLIAVYKTAPDTSAAQAATAGVGAVRTFRLALAPMPERTPWQFMIICDLNKGDPEAAREAFLAGPGRTAAAVNTYAAREPVVPNPYR